MVMSDLRLFVVVLACISGIEMLPAPATAAGAADDGFAAMKVQRISPPQPVADLVLRTVGGSSVRLADFKGKVAVLWFFLTN